jgi:hypothetical protein
MADLELLTLDLRSNLAYSGMENPPISGAPLSGRTILPSVSGSLVELDLGMDMENGEEELFLFDEEELVAFDPDEGPVLHWPLPRPRFFGRRAADGKLLASLPSSAGLAAGGYAFAQWRPRDEDELRKGLEWFAREAWWERARTTGPYVLRRVLEDGKLATQALRRLMD